MQCSHPGTSEIAVHGLSQWDYGQTLEIRADNLPAIVEVHFACAGMTEAIVRPCSTVSGVATVAIPDVCLEQSGPITAWVFEIDGAHGTTAKTITIPVISRPRPAGREEIPEEFLDEYQELITAANAAVGDILKGNITVEKAQTANNATIANEAQGAPNNGEQGFDDDNDRGRSFTFYNTNGFGIKGGTGHYKLWGQMDEEDGLYYPHIIPSVPSKMVIGHGQSPLKAVVADQFIGTADQASNAYNADRASTAGHADTAGEANSLKLSQQHWGYMEEYEIISAGVYLVMTGTSTSIYTDILCIPSWALAGGQRVASEHAVYEGSMSGIGYIRPYNESGNIRCVLKIAR